MMKGIKSKKPQRPLHDELKKIKVISCPAGSIRDILVTIKGSQVAANTASA